VSSGFASLGLHTALIEAAAAAGFDAPSPIQRAAIPVLRRGGNAVLTATSGSGVTAAVVLAMLDRLVRPDSPMENADGDAGILAGPVDTAASAPTATDASDDGAIDRPLALVLTATEERAAAIARTAAVLAGATGVGIRAWTAAWNAKPARQLLVAPAATAARAIRESVLKLDRLVAFVIDGIDLVFALEGESALDTITVSVPAAAQRVVTAGTRTPAIDRFVESHARRAITIPARAADPGSAPAVGTIGTLTCLIVPGTQKPDALARLLRRPRAGVPVVAVRSSARAEEVRRDLRLRGWRADGPGAEVQVLPASDAERPIIACDVPFDAETLASMDLADGIVMADARELPHLRSIAREAGITLTAVGGTRAPRGSATAFRARIRKAIAEQDLDAQLALLGPLLDEYAPEEVAAALSALLRRRMDETAQAANRDEAPAAAAAPAFVRLFLSVGHRDNIRPGDIVGAITGEASIAGDRIGRIDIKDNISVVEVSAEDADRIIRALNGTTFKGRSLRVDYDRRPGTSGAPARRPRTPGTSRRTR